MDDIRLGAVEARFAEMIWSHAPISSGELAAMAQRELGWKKSTAYTVLKRLCEKGLFCNEGGAVTPRISKEEYEALQTEQFLEHTFSGSLPAFLAAFTRRKSLSAEEIRQLRTMIDSFPEDDHG